VPLGTLPVLSWCGEVSLEGILSIIDMDSHSHARLFLPCESHAAARFGAAQGPAFGIDTSI